MGAEISSSEDNPPYRTKSSRPTSSVVSYGRPRTSRKSARMNRQRLEAIRGPMTSQEQTRQRKVKAIQVAAQESESFQPFLEFPTPYLLSEANRVYAMTNFRAADDRHSILPYPCPSKKQDVFDPAQYTHVDAIAISINKEHYKKSLKEFTSLLVDKFRGDALATVRVIFRWLANLDLEGVDMEDDNVNTEAGDKSVTDWLRKLKKDPSYCLIFLKMCGYAKIPCKFLHGYVKHGGYEIGEKPTETDTGEWVAVLVGDAWRLIDPTWCCSGVVGSHPGGNWQLVDDNGERGGAARESDHQTIFMVDEDYFLMDPERFICSHFPLSGGSWQLLAREVTLDEFIDMANVEPAFFTFGLRLIGQKKCVLRACDGEVAIQVGTPAEGKRFFEYKLYIAGKKKVDSKMDRFCLMAQRDGILNCKLFFPAPGRYKFELCAGDADAEVETSALVCTYIIHTDKAKQKKEPLPENARQEWGPGTDLEKAGLRAVSHKDAMIEAEDGTAKVRLKLKRDVKIRNELCSNSKTSEELEGRVLHAIDRETSDVSINVSLPSEGQYALNMYAKSEEDDAWSSICSYVMSSARAAFDLGETPSLEDGQVGALTCERVTLKLTSNESPIIDCPDTGRLKLKFKCSMKCDTFTKLELQKKDKPVEMEDFIWSTHSREAVKYKVHVPEAGNYKLTVYARGASSSVRHEKAFVAVIKVPAPKAPCNPFPKQLEKWADECRLIEPTSGLLPGDSSVQFALEVPGASSVTVCADGTTGDLRQDDDKVWRGEVKTPAAGQQIKVDAQFSDAESTTILSYKTEDAETLRTRAALQKEHREASKTRYETQKSLLHLWKQERERKFDELKAEFEKAVQNRDSDAIKKAIEGLEQKVFSSRMKKRISEARMLLEYLKYTPTINQDKLLEIRHYASPPAVIHDVIIVVLLLLGQQEYRTKNWDKCRKRIKSIGKDGVNLLIAKLDIRKLNAEIVARAQEILGEYQSDHVKRVNEAVGQLHLWALNVIEKYGELYPSKKFARPATAPRQRELLREATRNEL